MFYCKKNRYRRSLYCIARDWSIFLLKQFTFLCVIGGGLHLFNLLWGWRLTLPQNIGLAACTIWLALMFLLGIACYVESNEREFTRKECIAIAVVIAELTAFYGIVAAVMYCC